MSALSALLERLRRMRPPPGVPAAALGVPSAGEDVAGEVAFLLSALDDTDQRARETLAAARAEVQRIEADALAQRERIRAEALTRAEQSAERMLAERRRACAAEAAAILAEAEREAARVLEGGRSATPELVQSVMSRVMEA